MILALDFGKFCGWALYDTGLKKVFSGMWLLQTDRFDGGGMKFLKLKRHLVEVHRTTPIKLIAYEEVRRHHGVSAAHIYGGYQAIVTAWCEEEKVPCYGVPVGTIKRHGTRYGAASKGDMIKAAKTIYPDQLFGKKADDQADALVLLNYACGQYAEALETKHDFE